MNGMGTVVVVHETAAPEIRRLVALCDDHLTIVKRATWAAVDEVVGFSSVLACEACDLVPSYPLDPRPAHATGTDRRSHLRSVPTQR